MAEIEVGQRCALCQAENKLTVISEGKTFVKAELSGIIFCDECRKRLLRLLYEEVTD